MIRNGNIITTSAPGLPAAGTKSSSLSVFLGFVDHSGYFKRRGTTKDAKDTKPTDAKEQEVDTEIFLRQELFPRMAF
jgi:hypothetical protein